jgi:predicted permease
LEKKKLMSIWMAAFVVWMQRTGQLPADTPVVLSQVAFRVLIPCFLMSKVHTTYLPLFHFSNHSFVMCSLETTFLQFSLWVCELQKTFLSRVWMPPS